MNISDKISTQLCARCGNAILRPSIDGLTRVLCPVCEREVHKNYIAIARTTIRRSLLSKATVLVALCLMAAPLVVRAEFYVGNLITWQVTGKPAVTGRIVEVVRHPGRQTFFRVLEFGNGPVEVHFSQHPMLAAFP